MELKPGYKKTEVGVIPEDWDVRKIREVCKLINGRGFKPHEWGSRGLPIIRIQNLNGSEEFNYFDGTFNDKILVENGQLLFAWSGSRGTSFGPHIWRGQAAVLNYHIWKINVSDQGVNPVFFYYALRHLTEFIEENAHGASALVHTQKWEMEGFDVAIPPRTSEQEAIAEALSDVDASIAALARLIAKKRDLRHGAMQRLLTGQTRLPGFTAPWQEKRLGQLGDIRSGGTPSTADPAFWDGGIPWCTPTDITALSGRKTLHATARSISARGLSASSAEVIPPRSLIMTSRATIGACAINSIPMTTNQGFKNIVPNGETDVDFLYYLMGAQTARLIALCGGSTFLEFGKKQLSAFEVVLPDNKVEQTAIAAVLSDMDAEIDALDARLEKTRALKQAMMQALLTGRVRLPVRRDAATKTQEAAFA